MLGLFSKLVASFKRRECPPPTRTVFHPVLGELRWSDDDEAWHGKYANYAFQLGCNYKAEPGYGLAEFAVSVMKTDHLQLNLDQANIDSLATLEELYWDEISGLTLGEIMFYEFKQDYNILADLVGGRDGRAWMLEFKGKKHLVLLF